MWGKFTFIGLIVVAVIAVGCGGGGGDSTTGGTGSAEGTQETGEGTTANSSGEEGKSEEGKGEEGKSSGPKAEFIKAGDEVCKKVPSAYQEKLKALEKELKGKKPSKAEENLKAAVPPLYTAIEELEALEPPSGEEEQAEAIIASLESAAKGLEANPTAELAGPKSPFAEFQKLTGEYGFKLCSQL